MIRRPPRSTRKESSAASDVYKRQSYKVADVRAFCDKVRLVMCNIDTSALDKQLMFQWLFEKFRKWSAISIPLDKIRDSPEGSKYRTWQYLWNQINRFLDHFHEDENYDVLVSSIQGHRINAAPGRPKGPKGPTQPQQPSTITTHMPFCAHSSTDPDIRHFCVASMSSSP